LFDPRFPLAINDLHKVRKKTESQTQIVEGQNRRFWRFPSSRQPSPISLWV